MRCTTCLGEHPHRGGPIPVLQCSCGHCKCAPCVAERRRRIGGVPPMPRMGGIIVPEKAR